MAKDRLDYFNNEDLNLTLLMEECAEVIHICSKIKRFGWNDWNPESKEISNRLRLEQELGDVAAMLEILTHYSKLSESNMMDARDAKLKKLKKYYMRLEDE